MGPCQLELPLPSFIIVGAQKSATRWLRYNMGLHPEIFAAPQEIKFFNHLERYRALGPDWYRGQFEGWAGEPITGEATPGYLMWRHGTDAVARRIDETVPACRLIAILRNPVDRAASAFIHHVKQERLKPGTRLLDFVRAEPPESEWLGLISGGWYARSLEPYAEIFGDRLLVILHDDIGGDGRVVFERALHHVSASTTFVPPTLGEVRASNRSGSHGSTVVVAEQDRRELFEYFRDDIARLEALLGRDLSQWKPHEAPQYVSLQGPQVDGMPAVTPTG